jgi:hypothetical protein
MPFVIRDASGKVCGVLRESVAGSELLSAEHPEVRAFLSSMAPTDDTFGRLDAEFVRVLEDVIETLISRNLIAITDLPDSAQAKLFARKSFREHSGRSALQLFQHTEGGDII